MNIEWQQHLQNVKAKIDNGVVTGFTDAQAELHAAAGNHVLADLSHLGLISASGEDATDFLQGQFSNDIKQITAEYSHLSAYCSPKGRILAAFRVFSRDGNYLLELPASLLEATLKRLRMFVMRSQVSLDDASDNLARFGFAGPEADSRLAKLLDIEAPATPNQSRQSKGITLIRIPGPQPRFELHGEAATLLPLWTALSAEAQAVGVEAWSWLDTQAGIPSISPDTVEAFVPQMVNLHSIDAVNFKKGCFPGQEVVARMHYLGKLKRRMYLAHVDADTLPAAGTNLFAAGSSDEQSAGKVVQAQHAPQGGIDLLAVIQIATAESSPLHLASPSGAQLELGELPYEVTNEA